MNAEELKGLIQKYYNGESTEEEELALREYFNKNYIPEGYETEKDIFGYFAASVEVPEPSLDFEARILAGVNSSDKKRGSQIIKKYLLPSISVAAGLLILGGSYFFFIHRIEHQDTFRDPKIAYAETIKILMDVSAQLNHGTKALEPVGKMNELTTKSFEAVSKSTIEIQKNLKSLNYLQNALNITRGPIENKKNK